MLGSGFAPSAQALPDYLEVWKKRYGVTAASDGNCLTCHTLPKGMVLNPYGKDLKKIGVTNDMFRKTELLDSDKDGFSNIEEIRANTRPGDAKSFPLPTKELPTSESHMKSKKMPSREAQSKVKKP